MKNFDEFKEELKNNKIEITEYEFDDAIARVMADSKHIGQLTKSNPVLMLAFTAFGFELSKYLFRKDND